MKKPKETPEDICAHLGDDYDRFLGSISPPIFQTSLFTRKRGSQGYSYSRTRNPTVELAEQKIAALEGGEAARCFASGMAAITAALMHHLEAGAHVIAPRAVYAPTRAFLESYMSRFGVTLSLVDGSSVAEIEEAIRPSTRIIYLESPVSNIFSLQDLKAISDVARPRGIATIVDNTWATPIFQRPLTLGIDVVVHSASKYLGGHSDIVAGVAVGTAERMEQLNTSERGLFGASMDPHQAWLLVRSLRTLPLRMSRHRDTALQVATFLEGHPRIRRVFYPGLESHPQRELANRQMTGFSGVLSFVPDADPKAVRRFIESLGFFEEGPSWGGHESLINTPGVGIDEKTAADRGLVPRLVRISLGLEHPDSLIDDLDSALGKI